MSVCHHCGCDAARCGCCDGITTMTPVPLDNPPGLPALRYRVGTHGRFLASMKARLPLVDVVAPGSDHQTLERFRPLRTLTTRDPADPAIAMLDAWATVGDVLGFYQERIANEGYVRTAAERRSLVELSRLVGYAPRPGVSASVFLSYLVDDNQHDPVEIPVGTRSQSIPGPDESPQYFETSEPLWARREWNDLQVRTQRPQRITLGTSSQPGTIATVATLHVAGTDTGVQPGDLLLFRFGASEATAVHWVRKAAGVVPDFVAGRTAIALQPLHWLVTFALPLLAKLVVDLVPAAGRDSGAANARKNATDLLANVQLGVSPPATAWMSAINDNAGVEDGEAIALIEDFGEAIGERAGKGPDAAAPTTSSPDAFAESLLLPPVEQAANSLRLQRGLAQGFDRGADLQPQLLVDFAPGLKTNYYTAWRGTQLDKNAMALQLDSIHVLRGGELLFGATAGLKTSVSNNVVSYSEWLYVQDDTATNAFLARADDLLAAGDLILVQQPTGNDDMPFRRMVRRAASVDTAPRTAYGISADATRIEFGQPEWREVEHDKGRHQISSLRQTRLHPQKAQLSLVEEPILDEVSGQEVELAPLHEALVSGRWVVFEGERADIPGVDGVQASELLMIASLIHGHDSTLPGDRIHTTLRLATATAYVYKRDTLRIRANVVPASHGETRMEVLGSGDATRALPRFELKQPPLTWRPAPTAAGAASTLKVRVNEVEWREVDSLAGLGPHDRVFATRTGDDDRTTVFFGNGEQGARPPTGFENLRAEYRSGIGKGGNVRAGQISLMITRPLGVKEVVNPVAASGGADREAADLIRENAPRSVIALDRLVSLSDYADFTRMYAGIAKADAVRISDGLGEMVHITIAGVDDIAIDETSDLYRNLLASLRALGDPALPVRVSQRERIALALEARIRLLDGHRWEPVVAAVRARLLDRFGFHRRALGQPALLCEIVAAIQSVHGVDYVDVDNFGGIPEKVVNDATGKRALLTQDQVTAFVDAIVGRLDGDDKHNGLAAGSASPTMLWGVPIPGERPAHRVEAGRAAFERGVLRPAQLAIFTPAVADTLILNQLH
jgi:predicted phage baseplate assembly protein